MTCFIDDFIFVGEAYYREFIFSNAGLDVMDS